MKKKLIFSFVLSLMLLTILSESAVALGTDSIAPSLVIGGTQGSGQSEFDEPDSVYVDADGMIYAGDTNNLRVQVFDSTGTYVSEITGFTPLATASANEVQGIGELSDGTLVVIERVGNLYFINKTTGVTKNVVDLSAVATGDQLDTQGLVVDQTTDYTYITNQPEFNIIVIASDGSFVKEISTGQFSTPENMALDLTRGRIYVSAEGFGRIDVLDFDGNNLANFGKDEASFNYEGLALDSQGNIWAVDEGPESGNKPSRIIMFDPEDYSALYAFGGETPGSALGSFISPDGLAYDSANDRLIIADQGNYRLQVFDMATILAQKATYTEPTSEVVSPTPTSSSESNNDDSPISLPSVVFGISIITLISYRKIKRISN